jgi:hypothetical protein
MQGTDVRSATSVVKKMDRFTGWSSSLNPRGAMNDASRASNPAATSPPTVHDTAAFASHSARSSKANSPCFGGRPITKGSPTCQQPTRTTFITRATSAPARATLPNTSFETVPLPPTSRRRRTSAARRGRSLGRFGGHLGSTHVGRRSLGGLNGLSIICAELLAQLGLDELAKLDRRRSDVTSAPHRILSVSVVRQVDHLCVRWREERDHRVDLDSTRGLSLPRRGQGAGSFRRFLRGLLSGR